MEISTQFHVLRKYRLSCYFQRPLFQRPLLWSALAPCFIHLNLLIHAVFCVISLSCNSLWSRDWYAFQSRAAACDVAKMGSFAFVLTLRFSFSTSQRFLQAVWYSSAFSRSLVLCCSTVDVCDPTVRYRPGKAPLSLPSLPCEPAVYDSYTAASRAGRPKWSLIHPYRFIVQMD